ncbi:hypothetical protein HK097_002328 [Rhizophlyctis rosea]|uniref:Guanylate kinase n=1 Tax=Rhizophlyctis rosea TaxID=64517 RepID=A0AAD5SJP4_9FUNG|nr:hypothetical protein HK097_002328 [Rhizophlyctis rosea]
MAPTTVTPGTSDAFKPGSFTPRPIIMCGPSGSGKSTLIKKLFAEFPETFGFSVSHTTRKPRPGEQDGKDYHFVTRELIQKEVAEGKFVESAEFAGNIYGTSFAAINNVLSLGRHVILDIDMQGVLILQNKLQSSTTSAAPLFPSPPLFLFIAPPSVEALESRLRGRGTETEESLQNRLSIAKKELEWGLKSGSVDSVVVNDDVEKAYVELKTAIFG